jgi:hypothetical protein
MVPKTPTPLTLLLMSVNTTVLSDAVNANQHGIAQRAAQTTI